MIRWFIILSFASLFIGSLGCAPERCWLQATKVTYNYTTSCSSVANKRQGTLIFEAPLEQTSIRSREAALVTQAQKSGLFVDEVLLVWSQTKCPSPTNTNETPLTIQNFQRITLAPESGTSTVQRLLACQPVGKTSPGTMNTKFLLACRTGQSPQTVCTLELEPQ